MLLFAKQTNPNQTGGEQYSDTSPFGIPCLNSSQQSRLHSYKGSKFLFHFCFFLCTILFRTKIFGPCPISQSLTHGLKLNQTSKVLLHSMLFMTDSLQPCPILKSLTHGCKLCQTVLFFYTVPFCLWQTYFRPVYFYSYLRMAKNYNKKVL